MSSEEKKTPWLTLIVLAFIAYYVIEHSPPKKPKEEPVTVAEPRQPCKEPVAPLPPPKQTEPNTPPKGMPKVIEIGEDSIERFIFEKKEK